MVESKIEKLFPPDDNFDQSNYDILLEFEDASRDKIATELLRKLNPYELKAIHKFAPVAPIISDSFRYTKKLVDGYDLRDPERNSSPSQQMVRKEIYMCRTFARLHTNLDAIPLLAYPREHRYLSDASWADTLKKQWDIYLIPEEIKGVAGKYEYQLQLLAEFVVNPDVDTPVYSA